MNIKEQIATLTKEVSNNLKNIKYYQGLADAHKEIVEDIKTGGDYSEVISQLEFTTIVQKSIYYETVANNLKLVNSELEEVIKEKVKLLMKDIFSRK